MEEKDKHSEHIWITAAKKHGFAGAVQVMLDAIEPIAPLAAQMLWVFQPLAGIFGGRRAIGDLADILDSHDGVNHLRQQLNENRTNDLSSFGEE